jgi:DNA-binding NarL/FixJ family response regulator
VRVVIADDSGIFRRGLRLLLEATGVDVVADVTDVPALLDATARHHPDLCIVDVKLPPGYTDEGVAAAEDIGRRRPGTGVLLLSTYADTSWAERLLARGQGGVGYLLKDRVDDVAQLLDAMRRVADGRPVVDQDIVAALVRRGHTTRRLDVLSPRERQALQLMAEGLTNAGIGRVLFLSPKTVETHVAAIFHKLRLSGDDRSGDHNRRVLAVLAYLNSAT